MAITINGSTGISGVNGSAATPAIQGGDSDTGIFFGTDTASIATAGSERLIVDASGNINIDSGGVYYDAVNNRLGVGTTSPGALFHCSTSGNFYGRFESTNADAGINFKNSSRDWLIFNSSAGTLRFYDNTAASDRVVIDTSGRLLVGTSTSTTTNNSFQIDGNGVARLQFGNIGQSNNSALRISRNDTTVGDDNPLGYLEFGGNDSTSNVDTAFAWIGAEADGDHDPGDNPTRLVFSTTADGASSPTERVRIDSTGVLQTTNGVQLNKYGIVANNVKMVLTTGDGGANTVQVYWNLAFGSSRAGGCLGAYKSGTYYAPSATIPGSNTFAIYGFIDT